MRVGEVRHPERGQWGKPLGGVRVLAAEQMQALPYATQLLARLGAEVVKVEPPGRGETGRASNPFLVDEDGRKVGATYLRNNLSKRSIAIDLKHEAGRALFRRLVPHFDVVAENFRAGSMAELGLGYDGAREAPPAARLRLALGLRQPRGLALRALARVRADRGGDGRALRADEEAGPAAAGGGGRRARRHLDRALRA